MTPREKPVEASLLAPIEVTLDYAEYDDKPQDECGVIGVYAPGEPAGALTYDGMQELQHRGQSGAGIAFNTRTGDTNQIFTFTGKGLIDHAIPQAIPSRPDNIDRSCAPTMAVGHTRYSTAKSDIASQPMNGTVWQFALAHNGHIEGMANNAASDSQRLTQIIDEAAYHHGDLMRGLASVLPGVDGAYSLTITNGRELIGVRDPWGYHPLAIGRLGDKGYILASEPAAFRAMGATFLRDVEPGEIVQIDAAGVHSTFIDRQEPLQACMFEYIYIARPDGEVNGVHVQVARQNMGAALANILPVDADLVVGVPDSGMDAAEGYAKAAGIEFMPRAIMKNQFVGRSFMEREGKREETLGRKLRLSIPQLEGQRIVVVDDSLIKGKTIGVLVDMLRRAGASEVHLRFAAPHFKYPCYMGLDTRETWRLVARHLSDEQIAEQVNADTVAFNTVADVELAINDARSQRAQPMLGKLCTACATGKYAFSVPAAAHEGMSQPQSLTLTARPL